MTPEQRLECFEMFEDTQPDNDNLEYFYNVWAKDYDKDMTETAHYKHHIEVAKQLALLFACKKRKRIKVLDIGAGTGLCGQALRELGFVHIDAIDGSALSLEVAKGREGVYRQCYTEVLVPGEPLVSVPEEAYDAIVCAGSFCPRHLQGHHLTSVIDCLKRGGKLILTSSPHSDEGVGLRAVLKELETEGALEIKKEEYLASGVNQNDDGTLWDVEKLSSCSTQLLAKIIRARCLEQVKSGGMTAEERMKCFEKFESTKPDAKSLEFFYDAWAPDYDKDMVELHYSNHMEVAKQLASLFTEHERKHVKVLDVGAGSGLCGEALHELGFGHIDAIDGSTRLLELAKKRDVYKHIFPELLVPGRPICPDETYDALVSAGCFCPRHLQGQHLDCVLNSVKKGGKVVIASSPHSDEGVGLRPMLKKLEADGCIEIKREEYLPNAFSQNDDATLWDLLKLVPAIPAKVTRVTLEPGPHTGVLAKIIRARCLEHMNAGGMTAEERFSCFEKFETTKPDSKALEHFYDVWSTDYDKDMIELHYNNYVEVAKQLAELIHEKERKHVKVLDVGAGTGLLGQALHELGFTHIDAIDGSSKSLDVAKKRGVYEHMYTEVLIQGRPLVSIHEDGYDAVVSSGSFCPNHLQGHHVTCFIDSVKKDGKIIISSSPHSDEGVGLKEVLSELQEHGVLQIKREEFLPTGFNQNDDGTLWDLQKESMEARKTCSQICWCKV
eukprot:TRINITY_DN5125_c0_g1_i1.p1 TRINITY_DN5125_c0_g1~~TRINITY_DN5125_c0_g1_i1.p1  ORF type:complete len:777 (+),score=166.67 TRINITY_DN5125_c0_g1_i1:160-2331(+)